MISSTRRLGFAISLLVHLGLAGGLWLWLRELPSEAARQADVVPVQMAMFAEAPSAPSVVPAPAAMPEPLVDSPPEPVLDPPPKPPAQAATEPQLATVAPRTVTKPEPKPQPVLNSPLARPVPPKPPSQPVPARQVAANPPPPVTAPPAVPAAAPRTAQLVELREAYKAALLAAIERHKFYPNRARRRRIEGQARVGFRIAADGRLTDIHLVAGSGTQVLDEAALETLRRLARVEPLPPALAMDEWALVVPIVFELR